MHAYTPAQKHTLNIAGTCAPQACSTLVHHKHTQLLCTTSMLNSCAPQACSTLVHHKHAQLFSLLLHTHHALHTQIHTCIHIMHYTRKYTHAYIQGNTETHTCMHAYTRIHTHIQTKKHTFSTAGTCKKTASVHQKHPPPIVTLRKSSPFYVKKT
jgi:hypothetical protein